MLAARRRRGVAGFDQVNDGVEVSIEGGGEPGVPVAIHGPFDLAEQARRTTVCGEHVLVGQHRPFKEYDLLVPGLVCWNHLRVFQLRL